jgi:hypothetical protein
MGKRKRQRYEKPMLIPLEYDTVSGLDCYSGTTADGRCTTGTGGTSGPRASCNSGISATSCRITGPTAGYCSTGGAS